MAGPLVLHTDRAAAHPLFGRSTSTIDASAKAASRAPAGALSGCPHRALHALAHVGARRPRPSVRPRGRRSPAWAGPLPGSACHRWTVTGIALRGTSRLLPGSCDRGSDLAEPSQQPSGSGRHRILSRAAARAGSREPPKIHGQSRIPLTTRPNEESRPAPEGRSPASRPPHRGGERRGPGLSEPSRLAGGAAGDVVIHRQQMRAFANHQLASGRPAPACPGCSRPSDSRKISRWGVDDGAVEVLNDEPDVGPAWGSPDMDLG